jgi:Fe(3+) dicitrate transport protein
VKGLSVSAQWSYVGEVYTDATNTVEPTTNAQAGLLDDYSLVDVSAKMEFTSQFFIQAAVNNLFNTEYATRRAGGYPGPGLLPGTGRNLTVTLGLNL